MGKELKATPFTAYIEPTLYALMQQAIANDDTTGSGYVRNLIIDDLYERKIITPEIMKGLLQGTNLDKVLRATLPILKNLPPEPESIPELPESLLTPIT